MDAEDDGGREALKTGKQERKQLAKPAEAGDKAGGRCSAYVV